jgi:hypothetical protein
MRTAKSGSDVLGGAATGVDLRAIWESALGAPRRVRGRCCECRQWPIVVPTRQRTLLRVSAVVHRRSRAPEEAAASAGCGHRRSRTSEDAAASAGRGHRRHRRSRNEAASVGSPCCREQARHRPSGCGRVGTDGFRREQPGSAITVDAVVEGEVARTPTSKGVLAMILNSLSAMWPCCSWQSPSADNVFRTEEIERIKCHSLIKEMGYIYPLYRRI